MEYLRKSMTLRKSVILSLLAGTVLFALIMAWVFGRFTYSSNISAEMKYLESSVELVIHSVELNELR